MGEERIMYTILTYKEFSNFIEVDDKKISVKIRNSEIKENKFTNEIFRTGRYLSFKHSILINNLEEDRYILYHTYLNFIISNIKKE